MGRLVNCFDTKNKIDRDIAYVEIVNGKKRFWSSADACDRWNNNNNYRNKCVDMLFELLGYEEGMKFPTVAYKKLKEYEVYGYEVLYNTLVAQKDRITYFMSNKEFSSEYGRVAYVFAILQNNIMDEFNKKKSADKIKNIKTPQIILDEFVGIDVIGHSGSKKTNATSLLGEI